MANQTTNIANLNLRRCEELPLPLPPLDEQRRIAAILDHADALRAKRRQVISHLDDLAQSIFIDMFGVNLGQPTHTLDELTLVTSGITKGRKISKPVSPVPYLAVLNVQAGHLNMGTVKEIDATATEIDRYRLQSGDLVLTEGGDPDKLGRGTVWRDELPLCLHQNHIFRVRTRADAELEPDYLSAFMASRAARAYFLQSSKQTTGIASINMTQLKALPVFVPSQDDQKVYLDRIRVTDHHRNGQVRAFKTTEDLFASLQSRAFRGEL
ncbi:hypothetical protein BKG77_08480 [Mycobacteroides chelonae]|nr:hypothetical protein BKG77_08480 [Mycobacteroides chelonae]